MAELLSNEPVVRPLRRQPSEPEVTRVERVHRPSYYRMPYVAGRGAYEGA